MGFTRHKDRSIKGGICSHQNKELEYPRREDCGQSDRGGSVVNDKPHYFNLTDRAKSYTFTCGHESQVFKSRSQAIAHVNNGHFVRCINGVSGVLIDTAFCASAKGAQGVWVIIASKQLKKLRKDNVLNQIKAPIETLNQLENK